jgi:hypothetical protein
MAGLNDSLYQSAQAREGFTSTLQALRLVKILNPAQWSKMTLPKYF